METSTLENLVLSERDFRKISDLVYRHCGINLHTGKKELVRARLAKRLRAGKFKTFPEYLRHVLEDKNGKEFSILVDSLSTNLTSFFREGQHFEFLRSSFLPALLERKRKSRNFRIRVWSAGCSSGEEPYSIAITLLEATYSPERIEPVNKIQRNKYLAVSRTKKEKLFEVQQVLKDAVIFKYLNLMKEWPVRGPVDFIFCRNVMIYFDKATQQRLISRFWDLLDSSGVLFTGHSESLTGIEHKFKYIQPTIYMKP